MSLLMVLAMASASPQPGFVDVLREARYTDQCAPTFAAQPCPPMPLDQSVLALDESAEAFAYLVAMFLRHERGALSRDEHFKFETSLNSMRGYYACLDAQLSGAANTEFATKESVLRMIANAGELCAEKRTSMLQRLGFEMPDFHGFDPTVDNDKPGAKVARALREVELLAADYHAMRRRESVSADRPKEVRK